MCFIGAGSTSRLLLPLSLCVVVSELTKILAICCRVRLELEMLLRQFGTVVLSWGPSGIYRQWMTMKSMCMPKKSGRQWSLYDKQSILAGLLTPFGNNPDACLSSTNMYLCIMSRPNPMGVHLMCMSCYFAAGAHGMTWHIWRVWVAYRLALRVSLHS